MSGVPFKAGFSFSNSEIVFTHFSPAHPEGRAARIEKRLCLRLWSIAGSPLAWASPVPTRASVSQPVKWSSQRSPHLRVCGVSLSTRRGSGLARWLVNEARDHRCPPGAGPALTANWGALEARTEERVRASPPQPCTQADPRAPQGWPRG